MVLKHIHDQVVVIFGASSGIGRATALKLANKTPKLIVVARDSSGIDSLVIDIKRINPNSSVIGMVADCTKNEDIKRVVDMAISQWNRIDTWIQVASLFLVGAVLETTEYEYQRLLDVNFLGPVRASKLAIPYLIQSKGSLIMVGSVASKRSIPNMGAYSASKHALDGFIESLRMEMKHDNNDINIVSILPSTTNTPIFDKCRNKMQGGIFKWIGPPPIYHPDLVADSIIYACTHSNVRDLVIGTIPWLMLVLQAICPKLLDWALVQFGWKLERTTLRKSAGDNFDENTMEGLDKVEGSFSGKVFRFSVYNYIVQHPLFPHFG